MEHELRFLGSIQLSPGIHHVTAECSCGQASFSANTTRGSSRAQQNIRGKFYTHRDREAAKLHELSFTGCDHVSVGKHKITAQCSCGQQYESVRASAKAARNWIGRMHKRHKQQIEKEVA